MTEFWFTLLAANMYIARSMPRGAALIVGSIWLGVALIAKFRGDI